MKVGIVGAGAWGTALAVVSARGENDVVLWSYDGEYKHWDNVKMPENIRITKDMNELKDTDAWLVVTPSAFFRETLKKARDKYNGQPVIICTKGAECATGQFMSEILNAELPECVEFGVLSGPQFAGEVAQGIPTGSTLAGTNGAIDAGMQIFNKLYITPSDDIVGVELCGLGKNAVALICGYNTVAAGENERALIFTQTWNEVVDLGLAMGAKLRTFLGLCGIGDLYLSATSPTSRNFSGGMAIAKGTPPEGTVEGIFALCGLIKRAEALNVNVGVLKQMKAKMNL